jgi:PAS domain S-box-containing protein
VLVVLNKPATATLDAGQIAVLEGIARGVTLSRILTDIVLLVERQAAGMLCSILLLDESGRLRNGAAPNLPAELTAGIDGCAIGPTAGSCGAAAFTKDRVVVADIDSHPFWTPYRHLATPFGLRSCWSTPILASDGRVLGTFAMYYREMRTPTEEEIAWVDLATYLASIAIVRQKTEDDLRRSERRAFELARLHSVSSSINKLIARAPDLLTLARLVCRCVVEERLAKLAWIGLLERDTLVLSVIAQFGSVPLLDLDRHDPRAEGGPALRVIESGEPAITGNAAQDAAPRWRDALRERGLESCGMFPLKEDDAVIAVFALFSDQVDYFGADETQVLSALAGDLSFAIRSQRKEAERQAMEAAVRAGESLRKLVFDTISHAVFFLNVEGPDLYRFASVNRALRESFDMEDDRIVGKLLHELVSESMWAQVRPNYRRAIANRERVSWESDWVSNGVVRRLEVTIAPIFDATGQCTSIVGTTNDITARIQAEAERAKLVSQLNQAQRIQSLGTLAGGIAHDFNNILAAISGNASLLLQEPTLAPGHRTHVNEIQKASRRAIELVRQILTFSRHAPPKHETLETKEIAAEALNLLRATLPQTITIEAQIAEDTPRIEGDATQFHQVLMNLGTNAAHALPARYGVIRVTLDRLDVEAASSTLPELSTGRFLRLRVADNGCGMDEATLKRAFDPFFTTRKPGEGTGLGLSVVHGIVQSHHGAVELRSKVGEGTVVTVYLPATSATPVSERPTTPSPGGGERIMYVDDEEALVFLLERALTKMGYRVTGFADATLALGAFRSRPDDFDVVITDLSMPHLPGPDLAVELRRIRPDIPIIMTSGFIRPEDIKMAQRLGINQLVYKANTIEELGDVLSRELAKLRATSQVANRATRP